MDTKWQTTVADFTEVFKTEIVSAVINSVRFIVLFFLETSRPQGSCCTRRGGKNDV